MTLPFSTLAKTGFEPQSLSNAASTASRILNRIAQDPTFASQLSNAVNTRNLSAVQTLVAQSGVPGAVTTFSAPAPSGAAPSSTVLTITLTVCTKTTCYTVTITIH